MLPNLVDVFTPEMRYKHWRKNLMSELSLPFTEKSHQYCLFLLDQCNPDDRKELQELIWNRFYNSRNGKKNVYSKS